MSPIVSVIIPTLNSERTLPFTLESIKKQTLPGSLIEIIVVDGGSVDATCEVAKKYGCVILENPMVLPEYAKSVGLAAAKGKFGVFLDSDEEIVLADSFSSKINLLNNVPTVHSVITAGLKTPLGFGVVSDYINRYGDPFSYFIYRIDSGDFLGCFLKRQNVVFEKNGAYVFEFSQADRLPICDGGGHFFRLEYLRSLEDVSSPDVVPRVFQIMALQFRRIGVVRSDFTMHYATSNFIGFLRKVHWRVVGNVHYSHTNMAGQSARDKLSGSLSHRLKKYLFIPYALTFAGPLAHAILLSFRHGHAGYLLHFPATVYTALDIVFQMARRLIGSRPKWGIYS